MATTVFSPGSYTVSGISPAQTGIAESFQAGLQANLTRQEAQQRLRANEQLMQMRRAQEARTQADYEANQRLLAQERAASAELMRGFGGVGGAPATGVTTAGAIAPTAPTTPAPPRTPTAGLTTPSATGAAGTPSLFDVMQRFESANIPTAVSPRGAVGLMQVLPSTAGDPGFGLPNIFDYAQQMGVQVAGRTEEEATRLLMDPAIGRGYGELYMNAMLQRYGGDVTTALVAYNAGPGFTDQWLAAGADPNRLPAETRNYIANIMGALGGTAPTGAAGITPPAALPAAPPAAPPAAGIITTPAGVRIDPNLITPEPTRPTAAIAEIDRILKKSKGEDKRRVEGLKAYAEAGVRRPIEEIQTEISQTQAELNAMPKTSGTAREASLRDSLRKRLRVLETEFRNERQLRGLEERFPTFSAPADIPTAADLGISGYGVEPPSPEAARAEAPTTAEEAAPVTNTTYGGLQPNYGTPVQQAFGTAGTEGEASGLYVDAPERIFQDIDTLSRQQQRLQALATYYQQTNNIEGLLGVTNQIGVLELEQRYLDGMVAIAGIQQENFGPVQALLQQRFPGRQVEVRPYTDGTVELFLDGESEARITWDDLATNLRTVYDRGFIAEQQAVAQENAERARFVFETATKEEFQGRREIAVAGAQSELDRIKARDQAGIDALIRNGSIELIGANKDGESIFQTYMNGVPVQFIYVPVETRDPNTGEKTTMLSPEPLMLPSVD